MHIVDNDRQIGTGDFMSIIISRNTRSKIFPNEKTWGEIAMPNSWEKFSHCALIVTREEVESDNIQDWFKLQEVFGGDAGIYTGREWSSLCGKDSHLSPVGAQFTMKYHILLFNM
jgi:hypothetical protein